jgi:cytochrome d ubiquinol oxidase subunit II
MVDLPLLAAGVIVFGIVMYVILDGFDLGVGILAPFARDTAEQDLMIGSIAPVWDGNETWLILGGAVLFGAFPLAYAAALPAFYLPLMLMLLALVFRGVAFEFRIKANTSRRFWTWAFTLGSLIAAFCQGVILGGLINGVQLVDGRFAGGAFDWLGWFPLLCGVGVASGYALLGATWLVAKTEGRLQADARGWSVHALAVVMLAMAAVSLATPLLHPPIMERWFGSIERFLGLAPVPIATLAIALALWRLVRGQGESEPFWLAVALFLLGFCGLAISLWPYVVPYGLTLEQAAAPRSSLLFVLVTVALTLPMVLVYTGYAYWVFRGKVAAGGGYGH